MTRGVLDLLDRVDRLLDVRLEVGADARAVRQHSNRLANARLVLAEAMRMLDRDGLAEDRSEADTQPGRPRT